MSKSLLKNIDILDLIRIHVYKERPRKNDAAPIGVNIECVEKGKKIVFDEKSLKALNEQATIQAAKFDIRDQNVLNYVEEFVARMVSAFHKNGLVEIVDIPDSPDDPYANIRKELS